MRVSKMLKRDSIFIKTICIFIAHTFILSSVAFGVPQSENPTAPAQTPKDIYASPERLVIPRDFGLVKSTYAGKVPKLIVHIQDAHCNFEAQSNIVKILENLVRNYGLTFVAVEGAEGIVDTTWFKSFPDEDVRKEVATYFMKKGEITGPEFLSITADYPIKLFGAETKQYYIENLNAFTSSYGLKEETEKYFTQIKTVLNKLKGTIYTEELKDFDSKQADYETKKMPFNDYVRYLQALTDKHKINVRQYDNFFKLISTLIYEKKIDFTIVDKERNNLIDELTKKLSKEALQELVMKSLTFKVGKMSAAEYYKYLRDTSTSCGIMLAQRYPNLANYIIYTTVYSRIENEKLFHEIKIVETAIKEAMFKNDEQRQLDKMSHHVNTVLSLINIKLLNSDFDYYVAHRDEFNPQAFTDFIVKEGAKYGFAYAVDPPSDAVQKAIPKLEDFYRIALKRDKAIVDNTIQAMDKHGVQLAVLVAGGFHTEGMTKLFEKEGVSYLVVSPNITKDAPTPYIQVLTNQKTPFEELLVGAAEAKEGMLAPILIAYAVGLSEEQLKNLSLSIGEAVPGADLKGRVYQDKDRWIERHAAIWLGKALRYAGEQGFAQEKEIMVGAYRQALETRVAQLRGGPLSAADRGFVKSVMESERLTRTFEDAYRRMYTAVMRESAAEEARARARRAQDTQRTSTSGRRPAAQGFSTINVVLDLGEGEMRLVEINNVPTGAITGTMPEQELAKVISRLVAAVYSEINTFNAHAVYIYPRRVGRDGKAEAFVRRLINAIMNPEDERFHIIQSMSRVHFPEAPLVGRKTPREQIPFRVELVTGFARVATERQIKETRAALRQLKSDIKTQRDTLRACITPKANVLAFDVGGSNVRIGAYNKNGELVFLKDHRVEIKDFENAEEYITLLKTLARLAQLAITISMVPEEQRAEAWFTSVASELVVIHENPYTSIEEIEHFIERTTAMLERRGIPLEKVAGIGISWPDIIVNNKIVGGDTNKTENLAGRHRLGRDERLIGKYDSRIMARQVLQLYALKAANIGMEPKGRLVQFETGGRLPWTGFAPPANEQELFARIQAAAKSLEAQERAPYLLDRKFREVPLTSFTTMPELREALADNSVVKQPEDVLVLLEAALGQVTLPGLRPQEQQEFLKLYDRLFRFTKEDTKKGWEPFSLVGLRGGRGPAGQYAASLREFTNNKVRIVFLPGAADDGRSWLLCSLLFNFPGAPDFGKGLLDLATNTGVKKLLELRLNSVDQMREAGENIRGFIDRLPIKEEERAALRAISPESLDQSQKYINNFYTNLLYKINHEDIRFVREKSAEILGRLWRDLDESRWIDYADRFMNELRREGFDTNARPWSHLAELFERRAETPEEREAVAASITKGIITLLSHQNEAVQRKFLKALVWANASFPTFGIPLRSAAIIGAWIETGSVQTALDHLGGLLGLRPGDRVITPTEGRHFLNVVMSEGTVFNNEDSINEARKPGEFHAVIVSERPLTLEEVTELQGIRNAAIKQWEEQVLARMEQAWSPIEREHYRREYLERVGVADQVADRIREFFRRKGVHSYNDEPDVYPAAEEEIRNADIIVYFNTTLVSNVGPAAITLGRLIQGADRPLKIMCMNSFLENEPPSTTGATMLENLVRMASGTQRYQEPAFFSGHTRGVAHYALGRSRDHFPGEGGQLTYLRHDAPMIASRGATPILSDVEAIDWEGGDYVDLYEDTEYWEEFAKLRDLDEELSREFEGAPVEIANDGDVAAYGAAAVTGENEIGLTLGTSLGGGIGTNVIAGRNYLAYFSRIIKSPDAPGRHRATLVKGTYSMFLSQAAAIRLAEEMVLQGIFEFGKNDRAKLEYLQGLARDHNDERVLEIFRTIGRDLGELVVRLYGRFREDGIRNIVLFGALTEEEKTREAMREAAIHVIERALGRGRVSLLFAYELEDNAIAENLTRIRPEASELPSEEREHLAQELVQEFGQTVYAARMGYHAVLQQQERASTSGVVPISERTAYVFDWDGTLTESNSQMSPETAKRLAELMLRGRDVALLTTKTRTELEEKYRIDIPGALLQAFRELGREAEGVRLIQENFAMYLSKGAEAYGYSVAEGRLVPIAEPDIISEEELAKIFTVVGTPNQAEVIVQPGHYAFPSEEAKVIIHREAGRITKVQIKPFGERETPSEVRERIATALKPLLEAQGLPPSIFVEGGGKTSVDITPVGKDTGIRRIVEKGYKRVIFAGDEPEVGDKAVFDTARTIPNLHAVSVLMRAPEETSAAKNIAAAESLMVNAELIEANAAVVELWEAQGITGYSVAPTGGVSSPKHGQSYLNVPEGYPVSEQETSRGTGYFWRGTATTSSIAERGIITPSLVTSQEAFEASKARGDIFYVMHHGFLPVPPEVEEAINREGFVESNVKIHDTAFTGPTFVPGSVQYTLTGGHYQGTALDIKHVTEGRGVQYMVKFDQNGRVVDIIAQEMRAGTWTFALPGYQEIIVNLGGLRFNDISYQLNEAAAAQFTQAMRLPLETGYNYGELKGRGAGSVHVFCQNPEGVPIFGLNPEQTAYGFEGNLGVRWVKPFNPLEMLGETGERARRGMVELYKTGEISRFLSNEFASRVASMFNPTSALQEATPPVQYEVPRVGPARTSTAGISEGVVFDFGHKVADRFGLPRVQGAPLARTPEEVAELVREAQRQGKPLTVVAHLRGVDGPGSSLDIKWFYEELTAQGAAALSEIPSTPTLASEFTVKITVTPAKNPNAIEYIAPDYDITEENPYVIEGPVQLNEEGMTPHGQRDAPAYIFANMYGLKGLRITLERVSPMAMAGGMEGSSAFNISLLSAASMLSGQNTTWAELFHESFQLDNGVFVRGPNGGQGALSSILGGAHRHVWLGGMKGAEGEFLYPSGVLSLPLVEEADIPFIEEHMMLVQAGKEYENGRAKVERTASLINGMWGGLLRAKDDVGLALHRQKLPLAVQYTEALARKDMAAVVEAVNRYVDIRDQLCKRWASLVIGALEGEAVPAYAHQLLPSLGREERAVFMSYYERHKRGEINLREISLYSDHAKELIEAGRKAGIALMPLGAGGPGANLVAISSKPGVLRDFLLKQPNMPEWNYEEAVREQTEAAIKRIIHGTGTLRGFMRFKISMEPIRFEGFKEVGIEEPPAPAAMKYNETNASFEPRVSTSGAGVAQAVTARVVEVEGEKTLVVTVQGQEIGVPLARLPAEIQGIVEKASEVNCTIEEGGALTIQGVTSAGRPSPVASTQGMPGIQGMEGAQFTARAEGEKTLVVTVQGQEIRTSIEALPGAIAQAAKAGVTISGTIGEKGALNINAMEGKAAAAALATVPSVPELAKIAGELAAGKGRLSTAGETPREYQYVEGEGGLREGVIEREMMNFAETYAALMQPGKVREGVILVAMDEELFGRPGSNLHTVTNALLTELRERLDKTNPETIRFVKREDGEDLVKALERTIATVGEGNIKRVVAVGRSDTGITDRLKALVAGIRTTAPQEEGGGAVVLNVDMREVENAMTLNKAYFTAVGLYDLAINIGLNDVKRAASIFEMVTGRPTSEEELRTWIRNVIINMLPRVAMIKFDTAHEAYQAARQALTAL